MRAPTVGERGRMSNRRSGLSGGGGFRFGDLRGLL
jgi:hypothetical protein